MVIVHKKKDAQSGAKTSDMWMRVKVHIDESNVQEECRRHKDLRAQFMKKYAKDETPCISEVEV
jgi:hypothetical protein